MSGMASEGELAVSLTPYEARVTMMALGDENYGGASSETRDSVRDKLRALLLSQNRMADDG